LPKFFSLIQFTHWFRTFTQLISRVISGWFQFFIREKSSIYSSLCTFIFIENHWIKECENTFEYEPKNIIISCLVKQFCSYYSWMKCHYFAINSLLIEELLKPLAHQHSTIFCDVIGLKVFAINYLIKINLWSNFFMHNWRNIDYSTIFI